MEFSTHRLASGMIIRLTGSLDTEAAEALRTALNASMDSEEDRLIVDMHGVDYISSKCVQALMTAWKRMQAQERFIELIRAQPEVRKVLLVVGLGELLPLGEGTMQIIDVLKRHSAYNDQALQNARHFLLELFGVLGIESEHARKAVEDIFRTCRTKPTTPAIENSLRNLLRDLDVDERITASLADRPAIIHAQIAPHVGEGAIIDVGAGDGRVAKAFAGAGREVQLLDVVDHNQTALPLQVYDGVNIPFPDKSYDYAFLVTVLHHADRPLEVLREVMRLTRRRIIVQESVYLNEVHRRFNMFFDWFYGRVVGDHIHVPFNFNSPEGWEHIFREEGLTVTASVDIGLDQVTLPEYHWLYVLDMPGS